MILVAYPPCRIVPLVIAWRSQSSLTCRYLSIFNNSRIHQFFALSTCTRMSCHPRSWSCLPPSSCPWVLQIVWCSRVVFFIGVEIETSVSFSLKELFCGGRGTRQAGVGQGGNIENKTRNRSVKQGWKGCQSGIVCWGMIE
jgi:hypothetical protein